MYGRNQHSIVITFQLKINFFQLKKTEVGLAEGLDVSCQVKRETKEGSWKRWGWGSSTSSGMPGWSKVEVTSDPEVTSAGTQLEGFKEKPSRLIIAREHQAGKRKWSSGEGAR